MEKNEVYVVVHTWQLDSGESGQVCYVFDDLEQAQYRMKERFLQVKDYYEERFGNSYETEEEEMSISIYEKGEYLYNHDDIIIYQREVE